jgi:uncharacterized protein (DUF39 family)
MSDFTNKPVKLSEEEVLNNCAKISYETINKLCNFFTADEPSTYLAYLHYNKGKLTEEEIAECKERYEIVLHNRNVKNKIVNERLLNKRAEDCCKEEGLTPICPNDIEELTDVPLNEIEN